MMLATETEKGHLGSPIPRGDPHAQYRAIEMLGFFQVHDIKNNVPQYAITNRHGKALIRSQPEACQEGEARKKNGVLEWWSNGAMLLVIE
jgi:hypothetical protein